MIVQIAVAPVKAEYTALGMDTAKLQTNYIVHTGILMLLVTLLSVACTIAVGFLSARTAAWRATCAGMSSRGSKASPVPNSTTSTASLITRSTNDVTQIQMVVIMMMRMVIYALSE